MPNITEIAIPIMTMELKPAYDGLIIANLILCIAGLIAFNYKGRINRFLFEENINLSAFDIIEVIFRIMLCLNVGFFTFQFFAQETFLVGKRMVNFYG